jgi:hypothetical protein
MKFKVYLRFIGSEAAIRAFARDAVIPESDAAPLRRRAAWPPVPASTEVSWNLQTDWSEANPETIEDTIAQVVQTNLRLVPHIAKHRPSLEWVSLVIVAECAEFEVPNGLYMSADTISAIQRLGVDFDLDVSRIGSGSEAPPSA